MFGGYRNFFNFIFLTLICFNLNCSRVYGNEKAINLSATDLFHQYIDNEIKADMMYKDKNLIVSGRIKKVYRLLDKICLSMEWRVHNTADVVMPGDLVFIFDKNQEHAIAKLHTHYSATIKGICRGFGFAQTEIRIENAKIAE